VPGVAAGHNERVGFGFTIVGMDQQDVYVERLGRCPNGSTRRCYMGPTGWRPVTTIVDTIPVKGGAPRIVKLEFTEHGPIVSEDSTGRGYVIRFVGSEPGTAGYLAQLSVNRATDWATFKAATARWKLPTENLIYADVDGNIGWVAAGLMARRSLDQAIVVPRYAVEFSPEAIVHVERVKEWWLANRRASPSLFLRELRAALRQAQRSPHLGLRYEAAGVRPIRRILLPKTSYHIYYWPDEAARIVRVRGAHRGAHRRARMEGPAALRHGLLRRGDRAHVPRGLPRGRAAR
jgi:hypothetical protein